MVVVIPTTARVEPAVTALSQWVSGGVDRHCGGLRYCGVGTLGGVATMGVDASKAAEGSLRVWSNSSSNSTLDLGQNGGSGSAAPEPAAGEEPHGSSAGAPELPPNPPPPLRLTLLTFAVA